jgi:arylsulfatase A-like enzyme
VLFRSASSSSTLYLDDWVGGARRLKLHLRPSGESRTIGVMLDRLELGRRTLSDGWTTVEYTLPAPTSPGMHRVDIAVVPVLPGAVLEVAWVWLATGAAPGRGGDRPPSEARVGVRTFGEPRRSLLVDQPRSYAYFLEVPARARLRFDYAARQSGTFVVEATADGRGSRRLFTALGTASWRSADVDLSALSGQMVRLNLTMHGGADGAWGEPRLITLGPPRGRPAIAAAQRAQNAIILSVDAARQDAYRPFNPRSRVPTPHLDALARESAIYRNAYTKGSWTLPALATLLTGRALARGMWNDAEIRRIPATVPLLPEMLRPEPMESAAFVNNPWISSDQGFARGWGRFKPHFEPWKPNVTTDDVKVYAEALAWIKDHRHRRFLVYLHTFGAHSPYLADESCPGASRRERYHGKLGSVFSQSMVEKVNERKLTLDEADTLHVRALYGCNVARHDRLFGEFLRGLRQLGILDSTIFVYTNDHGEEVMEHGKIDHGASVFDEVMRSPLLIRYPKLFPPGTIVDDVVELVDLVPTLLDVMGLPAPPSLVGVSLAQAHQGYYDLVPSYALLENQQLGLRYGGFKLVLQRHGDQQLYDLSRDPTEQTDVIMKKGVARRTCEILLGESWAEPNKRRRLRGGGASEPLHFERGVLDERLRRQLESLGYFNR